MGNWPMRLYTFFCASTTREDFYNMRTGLVFLLGITVAALLSGCACNPGYYAPPYKPAVIGCALALVPAR
jgi:hypothetical protein